MYITRIFIAVIGVLSVSELGAQPVLALEQVLKHVEEDNPSLQVFDAKVNSQNAKVNGAGAWMAPMIGARTFMTPYPGTASMDAGSKGAFMMSAEQDIPNPAKVNAKKRYLSAQADITKAERKVSYKELKARAKTLYYDLLLSYRKRSIQAENLRIMQNMKKLAKIRYPYNQGGLNQVYKAEGREYESQNMLLMTEGEIRSKKSLLNSLMNRDVNIDFDPDTTTRISYRPLPAADSSYLAASRSDVMQMDRTIRAMQLNIDQMRKEAKPDFRLKFDHMKSYSAMMPAQFSAMAMISVPIAPWSSQMYKSEGKSMKFEIEAMERQRTAMLTEMAGMVKAMEAELNAMQEQIGNYEKKILPALSKNLDVSLLAYQENKLDLSIVIDAWEARNMAQINYLDQLKKFYQMIVSYEQNIER